MSKTCPRLGESANSSKKRVQNFKKKTPWRKNNKKRSGFERKCIFPKKRPNPSVISSPANAAVMTKMCVSLGFLAPDAKNVNKKCVHSHGLLRAPPPCFWLCSWPTTEDPQQKPRETGGKPTLWMSLGPCGKQSAGSDVLATAVTVSFFVESEQRGKLLRCNFLIIPFEQ